MLRHYLVPGFLLVVLISVLGACFPRPLAPKINEAVILPNVGTPSALVASPEVKPPDPPGVDLPTSSPVPDTSTLPSLRISPACQTDSTPTVPGSVVVNGIERSFITYVPESYTSTNAYPLIFAFHGRTSSNQEVRRYFGLEKAMPDAIIVYPSGIWQGSGYTWANPQDSANMLRDYALFDEMLRVIQEQFCIHQEKILTVGHSLGAYFANDLACARPDVIRAVASLAGGVQQKTCSGTVSAMLLHHPEDRLVSISSGRSARNLFVKENQSSAARAVSNPLLQRFGCERYDAKNELVLWCQHPFATAYNGSYYPHNWPSQTAEAMSIFFNALP